MVEYYTGRDASRLSDEDLVKKLGYIFKIRELEKGSNNNG